MIAEVVVGFLLSGGLGEKLVVPQSRLRVEFGRLEVSPFFELPSKLETGDGRHFGLDARVRLGRFRLGAGTHRYETAKWSKPSKWAQAGLTIGPYMEVYGEADLSTFNRVRSLHGRARAGMVELDMGVYTYTDTRGRHYGSSVSAAVALGNRHHVR